MSQIEQALEEALLELDETHLDKQQIDLIRIACGKPRYSIADANREFLLDQFTQYGDVFRSRH